MTSITPSSSSSYTCSRQDSGLLKAKQYFDKIEYYINDGRFIQALDLYDLMVIKQIPESVSGNAHLLSRMLQITKILIFYDLLPSECLESNKSEIIVNLPPSGSIIKNTKIEEIKALFFKDLGKGKIASANRTYRFAVYYKLFQSADPKINKELSEIKKTLEIAMLRFSNRFKLYNNPTMVLLLPRIPPSTSSTTVGKEATARNTGAAPKENMTEQGKKKSAQTTAAKPKNCGKILPGKIYPLMPTEKRKGADIQGNPLDFIFYR